MIMDIHCGTSYNLKFTKKGIEHCTDYGTPKNLNHFVH